MGPAESKLFSTPGSFNFSMAALAADPAALAGKNVNGMNSVHLLLQIHRDLIIQMPIPKQTDRFLVQIF